jgi:hypothetical protein
VRCDAGAVASDSRVDASQPELLTTISFQVQGDGAVQHVPVFANDSLHGASQRIAAVVGSRDMKFGYIVEVGYVCCP